METITSAIGLKVADLFAPGSAEPRRGRGPNGSGRQGAKNTGKPKAEKERKVYPDFATAINKTAYAKGATWHKAWPYHWRPEEIFAMSVRYDVAGKKKTFLTYSRVEGGVSSCDPPTPWPPYRYLEIRDEPIVHLFEGEKCADFAAGLGLKSFALAHGAKSPGMSDIACLAGKIVYGHPDNDEEGEGFLNKFARLAAKLSPPPILKVVRLPGLEKKEDIVDWFKKRGGTEDWLKELIEHAEEYVAPPEELPAILKIAPEPEGDGARQAPLPYSEDGNQTYLGVGLKREPLADFTARITGSVARYEGESPSLRYKIRATNYAGLVRETSVDAMEFGSMKWINAFGPGFTLEAGRDSKDLMRHAVAKFSQRDGYDESTEYTSTGWVKHNGQWIYPHAGGAIGPVDWADTIETDIAGQLAMYSMPAPTTSAEERNCAIRSTFRTLRLADKGTSGARAVAGMVAALPFRAVLKESNFVSHITGVTGSLKTSTAFLIVQYFASLTSDKFDMSRTPATWFDTMASLQLKLHCVGCAPLLVDEYKYDTQTGVIEQTIQSQGNLSGRARMNHDQTAKKALPPRGTLLSTGEQSPPTTSAQGRMLIAEVAKGDIDPKVLAELQADANAGLYAMAMACYIQDLAPRLDQARLEFNELTQREAAGLDQKMAGAHGRQPAMIAQLVAAFILYARFAHKCGAITRAEGEAHVAKVREILVELGQSQARHQEETRPGRRFLDLIAASIASGYCHLVWLKTGRVPVSRDLSLARECGWVRDPLYQDLPTDDGREWRTPAGSKCIGYVAADGKVVYLDPKAAMDIAQSAAKRTGETAQGFTNIGIQLMNENLVTIHEDKSRPGIKLSSKTVRVTPQQSKKVYWVAFNDLLGATSVGDFTEEDPAKDEPDRNHRNHDVESSGYEEDSDETPF